MQSDQFRLEISGDGSHTLRSEKFNALFHSKHGAIQESRHVFIKEGLDYLAKDKQEIAIFEVGFGTGLNAGLSYLYAKDHNLIVKYTSIDAYPIGISVASTLNYHSFDPGLSIELMKALHEGEWNTSKSINQNFELNRLFGKLEDGVSGKYDLIYFDAFASTDQHALWTPGIFLNMYEILNPGGILVTYACTGKLRRILNSCRFQVDKIPGPPGKREMIRAVKTMS